MSSDVSVVIPTFKRPEAVGKAVSSALAQTAPPGEIIVVVDGRDQETLDRLGAFGDAVTPIVPPRNLGNAEARNRGVAAASGDLIAFLDDDDEWMPDKLGHQLRALSSAKAKRPIVSCRLVAANETRRFDWPRRLPSEGEPICDYLFTRRHPATGEGLAQTSTLLVPRRFMEAVPFTPGLKRYVDLDWLLRAATKGGTLIFPEELTPLSRWSIDEDRPRVTTSAGWRWDRDWAEARSDLMTGRAHAAFLLTLASLTAARERDRSAFLPLLRAAYAKGRPSTAEIAFHAGNLLLPFAVKDAVAGALNGTRPLITQKGAAHER